MEERPDEDGTSLSLLGRHRTAGKQLQRIDQYLLITCLAKTLRQRTQTVVKLLPCRCALAPGQQAHNAAPAFAANAQFVHMPGAPNRFSAKLGQLVSHRLQTTLPRCCRYQMNTGADYLQISTTQITSRTDLWVPVMLRSWLACSRNNGVRKCHSPPASSGWHPPPLAATDRTGW